MLYKPVNGQQAVGAGFDAGIHYARFFNQLVGLGVGLNYSWANAYATYNWNEVTPGLTHASNPNVPYTLTTGFNNWQERQNVGVLGIPVEVLFRKVFNDRVALIGGVGVQVDFPIHGQYIAKGGNYSTTGVFPSLGDYVVSDMPEHGFSTYTTTRNAKFNNRAKVGVGLIGDLGARIALNDNWGFYCGIYVGYGLTNLLGGASAAEMVAINTTDPSNVEYHGTFDSNETAKANLLRAGAKIAFDFGWGNRKKKAEEAARAAELAAAQAREDSIAAALAQARADSIAAVERARLAAEQARLDSIAAAERERLAAEQALLDSIAAEKARLDSIAAERAARIAALKAKGETVTVHFDSAGEDVKFKDGERDIIDEISAVMAADPSMKIVITGHTDNTGNEEQNLRIWGMKRAEALKAYMVSKGVPASQIHCESKGQSEPVADNATSEGRAQNRRANIKFL